MRIEVDKKSGFCFGVTQAISKVEEILQSNNNLICLGDIVHNKEEVSRLNQLGMITSSKEDLNSIKNETVLIRSHGEPPSTYQTLELQGNKVIDATCPVVLKLQQRIKQSFNKISAHKGQLVIYGKHGHPEVEGLNGQTKNQSIIVETLDDLSQVNFQLPIELFCQTTMSIDGFIALTTAIKRRANSEVVIHDTICRQVANRVSHLDEFSKQFEVIVFVSGKKSSNGKFLHSICKNSNENTYFVSNINELEKSWFTNIESVGICGATSTPQWLMTNIKDAIIKLKNN